MKICLTPKVHGTGGMVSFATKFTTGLSARGIKTTNDLHNNDYDAVLVIGGTRDLLGLWRAKRRGIPIIQRLNGMNWVHRIRHTGSKHFLRAEYGNLILSTIRARLATRIVYQSKFSKNWWERVYGPTNVANTIIYNGVDLSVYTPDIGTLAPLDPERYQVLIVEGNLGGGYEMGLETGIKLTEHLAANFSVGLRVVGEVESALKADWQTRTKIPIDWAGSLPREQIPDIARSAHIFYAADLHPACPNAVIEALACGLPVVAFDTGALPEIVTGNSGRVVAYGSDPWKIEAPDIATLAKAATEILEGLPLFRVDARRRAKEAFGLAKMVNNYVDVLNG